MAARRFPSPSMLMDDEDIFRGEYIMATPPGPQVSSAVLDHPDPTSLALSVVAAVLLAIIVDS